MKYSILFRTLVILLYFLIQPNSAFTQDKPLVFGKVTDAKTGEPLILANVYLSKTMIGASSDVDGEYIIHNIEKGIYSLTASYVGYETQVRKIRIDRNGRFNFNFKLVPKIYEYAEVVVKGKKPKGWDKNLKLFTQYFLGNSEFSKKCKILNPYVLGFVHDRKTKYFKAVADDMLKVENKALGYILNFSLEDFKVDRELLKFRGEQHFEEMTPKNDKELRKWKENREKAYKGSIRHFLKSLIDSTTFEEGYEISFKDALPPDNYTNFLITNPDTLYSKKSDYEYELKYDDFLSVIYQPGTFFKTNRQAINNKDLPGIGELTNIEKKTPTSHLAIKIDKVMFDEYGIIYDPYKIILYGSWGNSRAAQFLPREYKPEGKNK